MYVCMYMNVYIYLCRRDIYCKILFLLEILIIISRTCINAYMCECGRYLHIYFGL